MEHWLKRPEARDLPLASILKKTEQEAFRMFYRARWGRGKPSCPFCGVVDSYRLARRGRRVMGNRFKCSDADCAREFTVTTNTIFWQHKLTFRRMLLIVALAAHSVKGKAALQLSREVAITYKSAWVMLMKIREALMADQMDTVLQGIVEMDGAHFGQRVRLENRLEDRADGRLVANRPPHDEQTVMVVRQRPFDGLPDKVFTTVTPGERVPYARNIVRRKVTRDAVVVTDEHHAFADLDDLNLSFQVPHRYAYALGPDLNTNLAESFFSRMRRGEQGIHHRVSGKYLELYAAMAAWHENFRRQPFSKQLRHVLEVTMRHPVSRSFCGYWQGNYPADAFEWQLDRLE